MSSEHGWRLSITVPTVGGTCHHERPLKRPDRKSFCVCPAGSLRARTQTKVDGVRFVVAAACLIRQVDTSVSSRRTSAIL